MNSKAADNKTKTLRKAGCLALWLTLWQAAAVLFGKPFILPSPVLTFRTLADLAGTAFFWKSCGVTLGRVTGGLVLACLLGTALALLSWKSPAVKDLLAIPASAIKSVPVMSVILFALLFMKSGSVPVFVCFLMCFPVMYTNLLAGFENVPKEYAELAKVYRIGGSRYFRGIMLPASMGYFKAGLYACAGLSWKSTVAAEVLSSPRISMGYHLLTAKMYLEGPQLFAWTVAIVALSIAYEKCLKALLRGF